MPPIQPLLVAPPAGIVYKVEYRTRVDLPPYVQRPYEVFVNGVAQTEGTDFEPIGSSLFFDRSFARAPPLRWWRWALIGFGLVGTYRPHDTIDVVYTLNGRRSVASLTPASLDKTS